MTRTLVAAAGLTLLATAAAACEVRDTTPKDPYVAGGRIGLGMYCKSAEAVIRVHDFIGRSANREAALAAVSKNLIYGDKGPCLRANLRHFMGEFVTSRWYEQAAVVVWTQYPAWGVNVWEVFPYGAQTRDERWIDYVGQSPLYTGKMVVDKRALCATEEKVKRDLAGAALIFGLAALVIIAAMILTAPRARGDLQPIRYIRDRATWAQLPSWIPRDAQGWEHSPQVQPIVPVLICPEGSEAFRGRCMPDCREGLCKRRRVA
jgi:hypothetical protein